MCWYSEKLKIKTAKKDIPVWKIVWSITNNSCDNVCKSFYKNYTYLKDILVVTPIEFKVTQNGIIGTMGFHSYSNKLKWKMRNNTIFVSKKKKATLMSLLSLLAKPYYRRKSTFVKVIVRIGTFWYTIRGSNPGHPD